MTFRNRKPQAGPFCLGAMMRLIKRFEDNVKKVFLYTAPGVFHLDDVTIFSMPLYPQRNGAAIGEFHGITA